MEGATGRLSGPGDAKIAHIMAAQPPRLIDVKLGAQFPISPVVQALQRRDRAGAEAGARAAASRLVGLVKPVQMGTQFDYVSEESLLAAQRRVADFHILVLADHFRSYYAIRRLPAPRAARYMSRLRLARVRLRLSGHITGTFAEAMAPWVLRELNIAPPENVFRLRSLEPSVYRLAPDLVITGQSLQPVEVKHAVDESQINESRLTRAILQLAAGLGGLGSRSGYLVLCTGTRPLPVRYSIQVIPVGG